MAGKPVLYRRTALLLFAPFFMNRVVRESIVYRNASYGISTPLGAVSLASFLERKGMTAVAVPLQAYFVKEERGGMFYDGTHESVARFSYRLRQICKELLNEFDPDLVGISAVDTSSSFSSRLLVQVLRSLDDRLPVFVGGNFASHAPHLYFVDEVQPAGVVRGEGEEILLSLLRNGGDPTVVDRGVMYGQAGRLVDRGMAASVDPAALDFPLDYSLLHLPGEVRFPDLFAVVTHSRGCAYRCNFCTSPGFWGRARLRSIRAVETEIDQLVALRAKRVNLYGDAVNHNREYFLKLCAIVGKHSSVAFCTSINVDRELDGPEVNAVRETGFKRLQVKLESADPAVAREMNRSRRNGNIEKNLEAIRGSSEVQVNILIGHPGSSCQKDMFTLNYAANLKRAGLIDDAMANYFIPFPGTQSATSTQLRIRTSDYAEWTGALPVHDLVDEAGRVTYSAREMAEVMAAHFGLFPKEGRGAHASDMRERDIAPPPNAG